MKNTTLVTFTFPTTSTTLKRLFYITCTTRTTNLTSTTTTSKTCKLLQIRVVNAFRSGIDRSAPPPALLRRAAAMKSASLDANASIASMYGDSHPNLANLFPSSSSSTGLGGSRSGILGLGSSGSGPLSGLRNAQQPTSHLGGRGAPPAAHHLAHHSTASSSAAVGPGGRSYSTDTELDGLRNDQIEALLRSETTEVLEEEIDEFFPSTEPLSASNGGSVGGSGHAHHSSSSRDGLAAAAGGGGHTSGAHTNHGSHGSHHSHHHSQHHQRVHQSSGASGNSGNGKLTASQTSLETSV